jgi:hypothetical protein
VRIAGGTSGLCRIHLETRGRQLEGDDGIGGGVLAVLLVGFHVALNLDLYAGALWQWLS